MKLRHDFAGGKMNNDVSDRLLPKGEYRQLTNGRTTGSYGDNVGVVEHARGNELITAIPEIPSDYRLIGLMCHENFIYYIVFKKLSRHWPVFIKFLCRNAG